MRFGLRKYARKKVGVASHDRDFVFLD